MACISLYACIFIILDGWEEVYYCCAPASHHSVCPFFFCIERRLVTVCPFGRFARGFCCKSMWQRSEFWAISRRLPIIYLRLDSTSVKTMVSFLNGDKVDGVNGACFGCTDVRDVALAHVNQNYTCQINSCVIYKWYLKILLPPPPPKKKENGFGGEGGAEDSIFGVRKWYLDCELYTLFQYWLASRPIVWPPSTSLKNVFQAFWGGSFANFSRA